MENQVQVRMCQVQVSSPEVSSPSPSPKKRDSGRTPTSLQLPDDCQTMKSCVLADDEQSRKLVNVRGSEQLHDRTTGTTERSNSIYAIRYKEA